MKVKLCLSGRKQKGDKFDKDVPYLVTHIIFKHTQKMFQPLLYCYT